VLGLLGYSRVVSRSVGIIALQHAHLLGATQLFVDAVDLVFAFLLAFDLLLDFGRLLGLGDHLLEFELTVLVEAVVLVVFCLVGVGVRTDIGSGRVGRHIQVEVRHFVFGRNRAAARGVLGLQQVF